MALLSKAPSKTSAAAKKPRKRRPRRTTEEIINRLIEAATEEFESNGYARTTTAAIARRAGVAEWLIFTHFGSKAKLFQDSIFKPLNQHFLDFSAAQLVDMSDTESLRKETRRYILELQRFLGRHSGMLISLLVAQIYECDTVSGLGRVEGLYEYFDRTAAMRMSRRGSKQKIDPQLMARISFATIAACIVFKDMFFPKGLASEEEVATAICDYVMDGINANVD